VKDYANGHRLNERQNATTRVSLILLIILTAMIATTVTTTTTRTTRGAPQQNTNHSNPTREGSPPTDPYWAKTYGGTGTDVAYSIQQTTDGGYVVAGYTSSFGAGGSDAWVLKLNSTGGVTWQKTYGGTGTDVALSVQQTADGGYIVAGHTTSFGAGGYDFWVLKLNSTGGVTWQKTYGGSGNEYVVWMSVQQSADGGYIVAGYTTSFGAGDADFWVLKLNSTGGVTWQKTYGGANDDGAYSVRQTAEGGYVVAGYTTSFGAGPIDAWVLKLNSTGGVTWQKTYGGTSNDQASSVQQTADGGYVVAGRTGSFGAGDYDFWVLKLNSTGGVTWQKTYGGSGDDEAYSVQQTADGGYVVAGRVYSFGAGSPDAWLLRLNSAGSVTWQKTYGGSSADGEWSIQQTADGGYVVAGYANSFGAGGSDAWVVKLGIGGDIVWDAGSGASTQTTSVTPSDSNAATSTGSVTTADSTATVQDTHVTPQDTSATVVVQASVGGGEAGQGIPLIIIVGVVAVVAIVLVISIVIVAKRKR